MKPVRFIFVLLVITAFSLVVVAPAAAIETENIAVSKVESTSAVLVVKDDVVSDVTIEYGDASGVYSQTRNSNGLTRHEVVMDSLIPSSIAYYQVTITNSGNPADTITLPESSFETTKAAGQPFTFGVAGDNRPSTNTVVQPAVWGTIIVQMIAEDLDLAFNVGDLIYGLGSDTLAQNVAKYNGFFDVTGIFTSQAPLYIAVGNHERIGYANSRAGYEQEFTLPENNGADAATYGEEYYSFDHGDTHFISLCTEIPGEAGLITGNQKDWLEADLAATDKVWIAVFMHRPLFSGVHTSDPWMNPDNATGQQNKEDIHGLFQAYDVDVVFAGHEHFYLHHLEDGINYVITGGGGAPLYSPPELGSGDIFAVMDYHHVKVDETTSSLDISVTDDEGAVLERFKLWALDLDLSVTDTYWGSYNDYVTGNLTVDYQLTNSDDTDVLNTQIVSLIGSNGVVVSAGTALPLSLGDLSAGQSASFSVRYTVPPAVTVFTAWTYATCEDALGNFYQFPGPMSGS